MKKILINLVHPNFDESIVNKKILEGVSEFKNITINNLYLKYPDFKIDIKKEQDLLLENDVIIFQFPMYWFSSPSLLKEWFDLVLEPGFAYGKDYKLKGKDFCIAVSCGAEKKDYVSDNENMMTNLLYPFYGTSLYIQMNYKEPFITYSAEKGLSEETLNKYNQEYLEYIKKLF
ncbi:general stress protein [Malaciobacter molluscorum LMG 25693]|uniref:Flavodoxin-like fold domain-containing protein n=1 Tax=Malaciobacter molluscorum LMG 25693 TaxID=870501 RepID=A0A2G1DJ50_9BACT|nr:NAD(P)H-dependent oxidoreductase [Malaciobacter molluscorum]AXX93216.1 flavodoxin-like fold domain-containing protein [Malaciobacter molluscorum LMG 25693]PHO18470.1 general stress protein [Malaciobacter molluscorum LMG 25693]